MRTSFTAALAALLLALSPAIACAAGFEAVVTYVTDGDTIWVKPVRGGAPRQLRLLGIDAPEICQAFGPQARAALAAHVLQRRVTVYPRAKDTYQRTLARVLSGRDDVSGWMVARGYAWSSRYRGHPGPYRAQEAAARSLRAGLWASADAQLPHDFRLRNGSCH